MTSLDLYGMDDEIFRKFSIKDTLFVHYNCPQRDKILELYSEHYQLLFTLSGSKIFRHGDDSFRADNNATFLLKRSAFLQELPDDYTGFEVLMFYIKDPYLKLIFDEYRAYLPLNDLPEPSEHMFIQFDVDDRISDAYRGMINYFEENNRVPDSILESRFKELLFNILSHPSNRQVLAYLKNVADDVRTPIYEVMQANYMHNLKIEDFAKLAGRSLASFKREFEQYYHTSPGKWLTNRRLKRAQVFLDTSNKGISEIAFDSGFVNISHFSKAFKDKHGVSPQAYRQERTVGFPFLRQVKIRGFSF